MPELYFWSRRTLPLVHPHEGVAARVISTERASLALMDMAEGAILPSHKHDVDELGTVVRGQLIVVVAGEQRVLGPGDCYRVPAQTSHGARVLEAQTALVACFAPAREDLRRAFERSNAP